MKKSYPSWLVPRLSDVVVDIVTARARLGGQSKAAKMTDEERSKAAKRANKARNKALTKKQRSELARNAGRARWKGHIKVAKERRPTMTPEARLECQRLAGARGQATSQKVNTLKQRQEWGRAGGLLTAKKRWGYEEAA